MPSPVSPSSYPQMTFKSRVDFTVSQRQAHLSLDFLIIGAGALYFPRSFPLRLTPVLQGSVGCLAHMPLLPPAIEFGFSRPWPKMRASPTPACACLRTCPRSSPSGVWVKS